MIVLGIDEAGRGAIIGPLVIAGALIEEEKLSKMKEIGVKDSKLLTPMQREKLYDKIIKLLKDFTIIKISAKDIDEMMKIKNLNRIECEKMAEIIKTLSPDVAYLDAPQVNIEKFKEYVSSLAKNDTKIIAENYADRKYVIVAAASIIAKVERDREVERIKKITNTDFGVGYPHDEKTIMFVRNCIKTGKYLEYVRKSWVTFSNLSGEEKQKKLSEYCTKI